MSYKPPYEYKIVEIIRVIDGDTVLVQLDLGFDITIKDYVRLANVNTPEIYGKNAEEEGKTAHEFAKSWLARPGQLYIQSLKYNKVDKYGRILGEIFRATDPVSLNQALIDADLGVLTDEYGKAL